MRTRIGTAQRAQDPKPGKRRAPAAKVSLPPATGSAGIAAHLRRAIADAAYEYGDKLPAEREIARSFGASRTTVREALRQLEDRNFVKRKPGSGTFVVHGAGRDREIADITSPHELMDVRIAVEPHIIRLALIHGTARDIQAMSDALAELEKVGADREHFSRWDARFHMAVANATHNPLMVWIYQQINEVRGHRQWSKLKDKVLTPARIAAYNAGHRALFEALQARDADTAIELLNEHLAEARRDLFGAQST